MGIEPVTLGVGIPVIIGIISLSVAWGVNTQKIKRNREDIKELKTTLNNMDTKLDDIGVKVARIDGFINGKSKKRKLRL